MEAVQAGGDRQELHERIRQHSQAAAEQVKLHGMSNDLIKRLGDDPTFNGVNLTQVLDPRRFIGRASQQVDEWLQQVVEPIRRRYAKHLNQAVELKV